MALQVITTDDLIHFKNEILSDIKTILETLQPEPKKQWVKSDELRRFLNVSASTLQNLRANGTVIHTRFGGSIYYDFDHVQKKFAENMND